MERKLASIQKISSVESIPKADRVEKARVMGWDLIVNKGQFKSGDLCVFFEIDSVVPERPEFEFMRQKKFRVKTMKSPRLGVISQGLAMPIDILPSPVYNSIREDYFIDGEDVIGKDVTEILGVKKFEPPISPQLKGMIKGSFPTHIVPKTDEIRLQSAISVMDEFKGKEVYITVKEDGTSFTAYYNNGEFGVCSRNLEMKPEDTSLYTKIAQQYNLSEKLRQYGKNIAIQGEITGDGINKNYLGLPRNIQQLHVFNVWDIDNRRYLDFDEIFTGRILPALGLDMVTVLEISTFDYTLDQLIERAKGKYSRTNNDREGIVIRPTKEYHSETLKGRLSIKVLNNDYLLKED